MLIKSATIKIIVTCLIASVMCGCRKQEINECESICRVNHAGKYACELRGALILPNNLTIEASLPRVRPVIDLASERIRADGLLPDYINITWHEFNDECEPAISTISAIDAYTKKCVHFIIGPSCEYSVAAVSRLAKYIYNDGLNVITASAFSYDFEAPKKSCKSEFHMLQRVGTLSFERIAEFMGDMMKKYNWNQAKFIYDRNGYYGVGGRQTCHLLMSSVAKIFTKEKIRFSPFVLENIANNRTYNKELREEVGTDYGDINTNAIAGKQLNYLLIAKSIICV